MKNRDLQKFLPGILLIAICSVTNIILIPYLDIAWASGILGASLLVLGMGALKWISRANDLSSLEKRIFRFSGYINFTIGAILIACSAVLLLFPDLQIFK
jgi:hypothetical protein